MKLFKTKIWKSGIDFQIDKEYNTISTRYCFGIALKEEKSLNERDITFLTTEGKGSKESVKIHSKSESSVYKKILKYDGIIVKRNCRKLFNRAYK